ncbi:MAG: 1,4-dihydroxy-2-naphthoate polyprenyltransferase [Myxococcota bacterium]
MSEALPQAATPALPRAGSVGAWVLAARPKTLPAAFAPVAVGTAVAHVTGGVAWGPALAALAGAFLLQIGSNLANDVFDYEKGADTETRLGPPRAAQLGLLSPGALKRGMGVVFALALAVGVYLTWVAGPVIVALGLASIASAIAYTGGPFPLGYHGLGDLFVMVFFGFVAVVGTVFVQTGAAPALAFLAAAPVGATITAILVVNNLRDREEDALTGKRTLAVRLGRGGALGEYALLLGLAYGVPLALALSGTLGPSVLLPWLSAPLAFRLFQRLRALSGAPLNAVLVGTAKLVSVHGVLFALGIALGGGANP